MCLNEQTAVSSDAVGWPSGRHRFLTTCTNLSNQGQQFEITQHLNSVHPFAIAGCPLFLRVKRGAGGDFLRGLHDFCFTAGLAVFACRTIGRTTGGAQLPAACIAAGNPGLGPPGKCPTIGAGLVPEAEQDTDRGIGGLLCHQLAIKGRCDLCVHVARAGRARAAPRPTVDRKSGKVHADGNANGSLAGSLTQTVSAPTCQATANGSANGSGSASGNADAQLVGTDGGGRKPADELSRSSPSRHIDSKQKPADNSHR